MNQGNAFGCFLKGGVIGEDFCVLHSTEEDKEEWTAFDAVQEADASPVATLQSVRVGLQALQKHERDEVLDGMVDLIRSTYPKRLNGAKLR